MRSFLGLQPPVVVDASKGRFQEGSDPNPSICLPSWVSPRQEPKVIEIHMDRGGTIDCLEPVTIELYKADFRWHSARQHLGEREVTD